MRKTFLAVALTLLMVGCGQMPDAGVSIDLAKERKAAISDLRYELGFDIPDSLKSPVEGTASILFKLAQKGRIVLDSRGNAIHAVTVNGHVVDSAVVNEHIVIPAKYSTSGENEVNIVFTAGDQSLNRREHFLYTLLVPDRARTLFPCFDQPDLKAQYTLSLEVPEQWVAVSNTARASETVSSGRRSVHFAQTEPLSTYLFSFVAGEFEEVTSPGVTAAGTEVHLYHRETDPDKVAQCPEVLRLVKTSLDFMEDYTGVKYPFAKYDLIVLPDFQYGGMEHTGATLYNDRRIFLGAKPTTDELLSRAALIAHETSHMWFGDYVTMKWFDDVWTKEVFANWFAAKMARPVFPQINHDLGDLKSYYSPAYSEDRTPGSNAVQRPLDNLANAGLIYCNIIYDKAPVVMEMLARRMGYDAFRRGVQDYVQRFGYSNATWDDLIEILDGYADFDVSEWSRVWIKEKGMPVFKTSVDGSHVTVSQSDPFSAGNIWQEDVEYTLYGNSGESAKAVASFTGESSEATLDAGFAVAHVVPNTDAKAYGRFVVGEDDTKFMMDLYPQSEDENLRMSLLMTLYENVWHKDLDGGDFVAWVCNVLKMETNGQIQSSLLSNAGTVADRLGASGEQSRSMLETLVWDISSDSSLPHELRLLAFRRLVASSTGERTEALYDMWASQKPFDGLSIGESDWSSMAYQLMLRCPDRAADIRRTQLDRITNPDRKESFTFISQAVSADKSERDAFFNSLLTADGRPNESVVRSALSLLNNTIRQDEAVAYIRPALEVLEDIQRTGDIFFPQNWCSALLGGHSSEAAAEEVKSFIADHQDMNPLLMTKVLQAAGWLIQ